MKRTSLHSGRLAVLYALSLFLAAPSAARSWDQFGKYIFDSHTVLTRSAAEGANGALRGTQSAAIEAWLKELNQKPAADGLVPKDLVLDMKTLKGGFYQTDEIKYSTLLTSNRLQLGNVAADYPQRLTIPGTSKSALFRFYSQVWNEQLGVELAESTYEHFNPNGLGMSVHFLRAYTDTGGTPPVKLDSARLSCDKAVSLIEKFTESAWKEWLRGTNAADKSEALRAYELMYFALGVAAHTIEDSFSPAHTQRSVADPRVIEDLCYYYDNALLPPAEAKACVHLFGFNADPRDSIHFKGDDKYPGTAVPARLAAMAAQAYLTSFGELALDEFSGGRARTLAGAMQEFLVTGRNVGQGYFDCSTLPAN
ncbi:MAG: hypothetical protein NTY45_00775 [Elusimicrobia bacterium]|nr:hypothetical protein [Elusimicrobiota bacterium]